MKTSEGLTLIEVLVALAILAVITTVFSTSLISTLNSTRQTGNQTDANAVLNFFGRMAAGGAGRPLAYSPADGKKEFNYGSLKTAFPELSSGDAKIKNPDLYKVTVTSPGTVTIGAITLYRYSLRVCWQDKGKDACLSGLTVGPLGTPSEQVVN